VKKVTTIALGQYYAREKKTRRADFSIHYRVQGSPLPLTAQVILPSCRQRRAALPLSAGVTPAFLASIRHDI
jgi:hypothetical protein